MIIYPHRFSGLVRVPASKSHTIRRLILASMADGIFDILHPLDCPDTRSCVSVCRALGAEIDERRAIDLTSPNPVDEKGEKLVSWNVRGLKKSNFSSINMGTIKETKQNDEGNIQCNVGNSGTTLFLALAMAALGTDPVTFDGDEQTRQRSAGPLLEALSGLGVSLKSSSYGSVPGCVPITIRGPLKGGRVSISCPTSQYLSALLLAAPFAPAGVVTEIDVPLLNERPYIDMTLSYLDSFCFRYEAAEDFSWFKIPGGQGGNLRFHDPVPGDFSSAAFPAAAAAITGGSVTLLGLNHDDKQGDKVYFDFLSRMGCDVSWEQVKKEWHLHVSRSVPLKNGEFDLNDTPDLLPVMAAAACFAEGDTSLVNVAHARIKETDRIAVMAEELPKLGVKTTERPDGLIVHGCGGIPGRIPGRAMASDKTPEFPYRFKVDGRKDHRVIMALACAALGCPALVEISGAENAGLSYPGFIDLILSQK